MTSVNPSSPSNLFQHNTLRVASLLFATWTVICGFIAVSKNDANSFTSFGIWLGGIGCLLLFSSIMFMLPRKKVEIPRDENDYVRFRDSEMM